VNSFGNFFGVTITGFLFTVKFREVVDVELTICNRFDGGFIDPGPTGENIEGTGITWIHEISIRGSTPCFQLVEAIHELCKGVVDRGPDGKVAAFHRCLDLLKTVFEPLNLGHRTHKVGDRFDVKSSNG
jgi:hypothetical protein